MKDRAATAATTMPTAVRKPFGCATPQPTRTAAIVAGCWAVPYIGSKIHFAIQGKLGVYGGPVITAADTAKYGGAAAIAQAQWGNVVVGIVFATLTLLPLAPFARRWNRWIRAVPVMVVATFVALMTVLFLSRLLAGDGGLVFTIYLAVWSGLLWLLASQVLAARCSP